MSDKRVDELENLVSRNEDRIGELEDLVNKQAFLIGILYGKLGMNVNNDCNMYMKHIRK